MSRLTLSVIDQSPIRKGGTERDALLETIQLAKHTETLGYSRYWVAEHHNSGSLAGISPELLIGQIAAHTNRIRVGSGGVMLTHYSAFKVAENFHLLHTLYPDRIDLGLGRAPGGDQLSAAALAYPNRIMDVQHYPEQVDDVLAYLGHEKRPGHPFEHVQAGATYTGMPDVWLLGSGIDSAHLAAQKGLPFSYAYFFGIGAEHGHRIAQNYRQNFRPSKYLSKPKVNVAVMVICADTTEEATRLASSLKLLRLNIVRGTPQPIISPEEAQNYPYTQQELEFLSAQNTAVVGSPEEVRAELLALAERFETDDFSVNTITFDFASRAHSYALLAEVMGLRPDEAVAAL